MSTRLLFLFIYLFILFFYNTRILKKLNKKNAKIQQDYSRRKEPVEDWSFCQVLLASDT